MNNLLESEDDINLLEKKCKQAKNAANQDQFDLMFDYDVHDVLSGPSKKYDYEKDLKNLTLQRSKGKHILFINFSKNNILTFVKTDCV